MTGFDKKEQKQMTEFRQKAFDYSSTDAIGHVFLLKDLVETDAHPEKLKNACIALTTERDLVMKNDENKEDPVRAGIYKLAETMELAFTWYAERENKRRMAKAAVKREIVTVEDSDEDEEVALCNVSAVEGDNEVNVKKEQGESREKKNVK
ncbi:hypothetical protein PENTCL1PPCAC_26684 [Pristionchus entomophagus]|uniref:Uncharacterized protein n=1 Tax=Pristionchus entomophagus TaxID=358040 RepID=A0AAV5UDV8_9BILA|nr:hypothetical protein PENTCL1PPCAC_26684 [Pristionchus entomophagus]